MARPIIKIKTGSTRPTTYTETIVNGVVTNTQGLSAGELGATIVAPNYAFYIGNNSGIAITFGGEISTQADLGGVAASDYKIPTQRALKTYIDQNSGNPGTSAVSIISRYNNALQSVGINAEADILFQVQDFTTTGGITELTYNAGTGAFTNNTAATTIYLLVTYQVTWSGFATTQSYNTRNIVRSAWIQKSFTGSVAGENVYGFTTLLCPPIASNLAGAITGTQNGTAVIELGAGQSFSVRCKNHGSAGSSVSNLSNINNGAGFVQNFNKATSVQIVKL
jgi:hypothetical protein